MSINSLYLLCLLSSFYVVSGVVKTRLESVVLERFLVGAGEGLEQRVGQAGGTDAEVLVVQPLLAQDFLDDGVVLHGVLGGADAARCLEAYHAAVLDEVFLDALAHDVGGL